MSAYIVLYMHVFWIAFEILSIGIKFFNLCTHKIIREKYSCAISKGLFEETL